MPCFIDHLSFNSMPLNMGGLCVLVDLKRLGLIGQTNRVAPYDIALAGQKSGGELMSSQDSTSLDSRLILGESCFTRTSTTKTQGLHGLTATG